MKVRDPFYKSFRVFSALIGAVGAAAAVYPDALPYGEYSKPVSAFCAFLASGFAVASKAKE